MNIGAFESTLIAAETLDKKNLRFKGKPTPPKFTGES